MGQSFVFLLVALPLSLAAIIFSANFFLRGAVSIAHTMKLPEFLVGSVIVAIGTSAPEMAINISAALEGAGDIVISNIVGSNIVNAALGVGIAALMLSFDRVRKEYTQTLIVGLLGTIALLANTYMTGNAAGESYFPLLFSAVLVVAFVGFMYNSIRTATAEPDEEFEPAMKPVTAVVYVLLGATSMAVFSHLAVGSAGSLSRILGVPEAVIGATVIAAGGSLPEISSCIAAARLKRPNLILGNIAGSQIFNILGILGLSGLIRPFSYTTVLGVDISILIAITLILMVCIWNAKLRRIMGPLLVISYLGYACYLIWVAS